MERTVDDLLADIYKHRNYLTRDFVRDRHDMLSRMSGRIHAELKDYMQQKDFSPFFEVLSEKPENWHGPYCEILRTLLNFSPPNLMFSKYESQLVKALSCTMPYEIRSVSLEQLARCVRDAKMCPVVASHEIILGHIIDSLGSSEAAHSAMALLLDIITRAPSATKTLFTGDLLKRFQAVQMKNSESSMVVLEFYCSVATRSAANCNLLSGELDAAIAAFRNEKKDILLIVNYFKHFETLVSNRNTLNYIIDSGVISAMKKIIFEPDDKDAVHLMPGALEFFGCFGQHEPQVFCERFEDCVRQMINLTGHAVFREPALVNMALVGRSQEGKRWLKKKINLNMITLMKNLGEILEGNGRLDEKVGALRALGHFMEVEDLEEREMMSITLQWFSMAGQKPLQVLWSCAKSPFQELRVASHVTIRNIALLSWGRDALLEECAGFYEWLLDRDTESTSVGKEGKHSIVAALVEQSNRIIDPEKRAALRLYFNDGPFFAASQLRTATQPV